MDSTSKNTINKDFAWHYRVVPKEVSKEGVILYIDENTNISHVKKELDIFFGKSVNLILQSREEMDKLLAATYRKSNEPTIFRKGKNSLETIVLEAINLKSSDIHFEIYEHQARIRYRIDGVLIEKQQIKRESYLEIINMIKIESNLDITEKRLPQDGRAKVLDYDLRVSVIPTQFGEKIVIRILGKDTNFLDLESLGFDAEELVRYRKSVKKHSGIVLISGPTGSGKTTTLYSTLKLLNDVGKNIVTVEDPIEYILEGVNQTQLREDIGLSFSKALKSILRQDPDIIMIGEIRDKETAEIAVRAALTGHLVLSTIHTNSASGIITRLIDLGIPSFLLSETLNLALAQRLVRKLCNHCKEQSLDHTVGSSDFTKEVKKSYNPVGCEHCHYTGYEGRTAIYEMIPIDTETRKTIKQGENIQEFILNHLEIKNLKSKALELVNQGVTSLQEVYPILL